MTETTEQLFQETQDTEFIARHIIPFNCELDGATPTIHSIQAIIPPQDILQTAFYEMHKKHNSFLIAAHEQHLHEQASCIVQSSIEILPDEGETLLISTIRREGEIAKITSYTVCIKELFENNRICIQDATSLIHAFISQTNELCIPGTGIYYSTDRDKMNISADSVITMLIETLFPRKIRDRSFRKQLYQAIDPRIQEGDNCKRAYNTQVIQIIDGIAYRITVREDGKLGVPLILLMSGEEKIKEEMYISKLITDNISKGIYGTIIKTEVYKNIGNTADKNMSSTSGRVNKKYTYGTTEDTYTQEITYKPDGTVQTGFRPSITRMLAHGEEADRSKEGIVFIPESAEICNSISPIGEIQPGKWPESSDAPRQSHHTHPSAAIFSFLTADMNHATGIREYAHLIPKKILHRQSVTGRAAHGSGDSPGNGIHKTTTKGSYKMPAGMSENREEQTPLHPRSKPTNPRDRLTRALPLLDIPLSSPHHIFSRAEAFIPNITRETDTMPAQGTPIFSKSVKKRSIHQRTSGTDYRQRDRKIRKQDRAGQRLVILTSPGEVEHMQSNAYQMANIRIHRDFPAGVGREKTYPAREIVKKPTTNEGRRQRKETVSGHSIQYASPTEHVSKQRAGVSGFEVKRSKKTTTSRVFHPQPEPPERKERVQRKGAAYNGIFFSSGYGQETHIGKFQSKKRYAYAYADCTVFPDEETERHEDQSSLLRLFAAA